MVFIRKKKIHGKERYYLEKSVRQRDGAVKKYSLYLSHYTPSAKRDLAPYEKQLEKKIQKDVVSSAAGYYAKNNIFTEENIKEFEEIACEYKHITKKLTPKQWGDIIDRFTVNFTYESNAIEGNSLTLKDVTFVLHEGKAIKGKDLREVYEVLNTRTALELIFKNKFSDYVIVCA